MSKQRNNSNSKSREKNSNNRYSRQRGASKQASNRTNDGLDEDLKYSHNDPAWYNHTPQLVKDTASISFYPALGLKLNINYKNTNNTKEFERVPGVMSFRTVTTYGISHDYTSALNTFADNMYRNLRYNYTGSKVYESPDLMMYLMTMDSCFQFLAWMQRIYGVCNTFSASNLYMPKYLLAAMDVDYNSLLGNLSEFRRYINDFALFLNTYYVPANIPMLLRHVSMYQNIYKDSASSKSQLYVFNPSSFWEWDESTTPGTLRPIDVPASVTLDVIKNIGNTMRNSVNLAEDVRIMSSDVWKAYGKNGVYRAGLIDESYSVIPIYDPMISTQIENMRVTGRLSSRVVYQKDGALLFNPYIHMMGNSIPDNTFVDHDVVINAHGDAPSQDWVMEATRLSPVLKFKEMSADSYAVDADIVACGSEIIEEMKIWVLNAQGNLDGYNIRTDMTMSSSTAADGVLWPLVLLSNFDWAPLYYYTSYNEVDKDVVAQELRTNKYTTHVLHCGIPFGDIDNYAVVNATVIENMHNTALMSLLGLPSDPV